jgi:hypothetical protein
MADSASLFSDTLSLPHAIIIAWKREVRLVALRPSSTVTPGVKSMSVAEMLPILLTGRQIQFDRLY